METIPQPASSGAAQVATMGAGRGLSGQVSAYTDHWRELRLGSVIVHGSASEYAMHRLRRSLLLRISGRRCAVLVSGRAAVAAGSGRNQHRLPLSDVPGSRAGAARFAVRADRGDCERRKRGTGRQRLESSPRLERTVLVFDWWDAYVSAWSEQFRSGRAACKWVEHRGGQWHKSKI